MARYQGKLDKPFNLYCPFLQITMMQYCRSSFKSDPTSGFHWAVQPRAALSPHAGICPRAVTVKFIWDTKPLMMRGC